MINIVWAFLICTFMGILGLITELIVLLYFKSYQIKWPFILNSFLLYLFIFGIIGMLLGILLLTYEKLLRRQNIKYNKKNFFVLFSFFFSILLIIGGWINYLYIPQTFSIYSVLFNCALFLSVLSIFFVTNYFVQARKVQFKNLIKIFIAVFVIFSSLLIIKQLNKNELPISNISIKKDFKGTKKINVVILVLDCLRPDHLSCYGYFRKTSPTIDRIASEGTIFTNAFAQSAHTYESVPSILTSLYPSTHNMDSFNSVLPNNCNSIFRIARENGITTSIFSETFLVSSQYGWNQQHGIDVNSSFYPRQGISILSYYLDLLNISQRILKRLPLYNELAKTRSSPNVVAKFTKFLDSVDNNPFISYIHIMDIHAPYSAKGKYKDFFEDSSAHERINVNELTRGFFPFIKGDKISNGQLNNVIARYDEEILSVDKEKIAEIINALSHRDLLDNTIIIITADHGEQFYEHSQWTHSNTMFCTIIRIPLIMKVPGSDLKDRTINEVVELVDIVPTILDLWNIRKPSYLDGESLVPLIERKKWSPKSAFSELHLKGKSCLSLVQNNYHLIYSKFGFSVNQLLFDIKNDPNELENIIDEKNEIAKEMLEKLKRIEKRAKSKSIVTKRLKISKDMEEHLRSLGYIK